MSALKRTKSGRFCIEDSYTLDQIEKMAKNNDFSFMTGVDTVLSHYEKIVLADKNARRLCNGFEVRIAGVTEGTVFRAYNEQSDFLALCRIENG